MRTFSNTRRRLLASAVAILAAAGFAGAAEMRTWTNLKGQSIKAQLLTVEGEDVRLRMDTGKDVTIERKTLSAADQKYLTEYGGAGEIPIDPKAKIGTPSKSMKFDSKSIIRRDDMLQFPEGFSLEFDLIETDHFLVGSSGRARAKDIAQLAERMWYGMSFQHPGFKDKWGEEKKVILLCGEEADYNLLGDYEIQRLQNSSATNAAQAASKKAMTWKEVSASGFGLTDEMMEKYKAQQSAIAFKAFDKRRFPTGVWNPFPTHAMAGVMLSKMMGSAGGGIASQGWFTMYWGHKYFKEIQLTGETVTSMVDADAYESDELVKAGGFKDGKKWARTLRDLVKKGKVTPDIEELWRLSKPGDVSPELTVLMYSFARYMQSTPARMAKFTEWLNRVDTSRAIPVTLETAKLMGFETVKELEDDWIEYVKSSAFK